MDKPVVVIKLNDAHVPFEDETSVRAAIEFCEKLQPDIIITDEWMDFYELSRFTKDPTRATGYTLHDAREKVWYWYDIIGKVCPKSRRIELHANHPRRLMKYLHNNAKELVGLPEFEMVNFMRFDKMNIEYMHHFIFRDFIFKHGDRVHKHSGYTAKNELEKEGMSGASGHTHRLGQHYKTLRGGEYTWIECGCLCCMDMDYLEEAIPDWHPGFGMISFWGDRYRALPMPIIGGKVDWV